MEKTKKGNVLQTFEHEWWIVNLLYHPSHDGRRGVFDRYTTDVTSSATTSVEYLELKSGESLELDGMPIPSIQMTAPLDETTVSISPPDALTRSSSALHGLFYREIGQQQRPNEQLPYVQWCSRRP